MCSVGPSSLCGIQSDFLDIKQGIWPQLKCTGQTFPRTVGHWPSQVWEEEAGSGLPANQRQAAVGTLPCLLGPEGPWEESTFWPPQS